MTSTSRTQPWRSASSTIRPSRGSTGSRASRRPSGVSGRIAGGVGRADRAELLEQQVAVADGRRVRRLDEREGGDVAEPDRRHLQDDRRQVGAQDLRLGELRAGGEVVLAVEADADARGDTAAPPGALVGRRLRHRLDRQALHLQPAAVAGDPGRAGVDDVAHARHGERRLGDVRAEHDASAAVRLEDAVLLRRRQPGVQRQHLGVVALEAAQGVGGVVDLALAGRGTRARRPGPRRRARRRRRRSPAPGRVVVGRRRTGGSGPRPGYVRPVTSITGASTPSAAKWRAKRAVSIVADVTTT